VNKKHIVNFLYATPLEYMIRISIIRLNLNKFKASVSFKNRARASLNYTVIYIFVQKSLSYTLTYRQLLPYFKKINMLGIKDTNIATT
jgi:hypothetical protein